MNLMLGIRPHQITILFPRGGHFRKQNDVYFTPPRKRTFQTMSGMSERTLQLRPFDLWFTP